MAQEIMAARERLADLSLLIEDEPSLTPAAISLRARAARRRLGGLDLLIIDHLHIMGAPAGSTRKGDTEIVTALSGGVKRLAKQMDVPVLLLAQLSRGPEGREDKRPGLSDLRQSGAIEQDVDAALFIYRPEYYLAKQPPERRMGEGDDAFSKREYDYRRMLADVQGRAEILSEKVRDGEPGVDFLRFDGKRTRFFEEGEDRA
jgi:replicative DNA helicase